MAVPDNPDNRGGDERFSPSAVLLGPGWGRGEDRKRLLETYLPLEEKGLPLILDADAIVLAKDIVFHGNAVLTPHPGEFAEYSGIPKDEILADPVPILRRIASEKKVHILFKSHVMYAVSPDGRIGIVDGMNPLLAAGGSGDVLAGFCASVASRGGGVAFPENVDGYACMCAAASLLIKASKSKKVSGRFTDPEAIARAAAAIAGKAWLPII
jgi:NAD(P)H-hydrate epimerase